MKHSSVNGPAAHHAEKRPSVEGPAAYRFHERDWGSYEELRDAFEWAVPDPFNIATYVCDRWANDRARVALFADEPDGDRNTVTFWQLRNAANRLANYLAARGVGRGDRIAVNAGQRPATVIAHVAAWKLGAVSVPLSVKFGPDALRYRLEDAGARALVVDGANVSTARAVAADLDALEITLTVGVDPEDGERDLQAATADRSRRFDTVATPPGAPATLIYTSGTTGPPKGVLHAHRVLLGHLPGFVTGHCGLGIEDSDVIWSPAGWAWIATVFGTVASALYYGMPVVAHDDRGGFDPETPYELVERYGVSILFLPPTGLRMMMTETDLADRYEVDDVRVIFSGGEPLEPSVSEWAAATFDGAVVQQVYGQTEANITIAECHPLFPGRPGTLGRPTPGHDVRLLDPQTGEPTVDPGEVGELAIRYTDDPVCFTEYWQRPAATADAVRDGWLHTGDLATVDADGYYTFVSRTDDLIISAGYRIGPDEIEDSLSTHEAVLDAGVVGAPDEERGEVPVAFVVLVDGAEPSDALEAELSQYVKDKLAKYEYPREIHFLDELPRTTTGKVRRIELEERLEDLP